jgi:hypothetical protein
MWLRMLMDDACERIDHRQMRVTPSPSPSLPAELDDGRVGVDLDAGRRLRRPLTIDLYHTVR